jgi:hypothetical protein
MADTDPRMSKANLIDSKKAAGKAVSEFGEKRDNGPAEIAALPKIV